MFTVKQESLFLWMFFDGPQHLKSMEPVKKILYEQVGPYSIITSAAGIFIGTWIYINDHDDHNDHHHHDHDDVDHVEVEECVLGLSCKWSVPLTCDYLGESVTYEAKECLIRACIGVLVNDQPAATTFNGHGHHNAGMACRIGPGDLCRGQVWPIGLEKRKCVIGKGKSKHGVCNFILIIYLFIIKYDTKTIVLTRKARLLRHVYPTILRPGTTRTRQETNIYYMYHNVIK